MRGARTQLSALDDGIRTGSPLAVQQGQLAAFNRDVASARGRTHGVLWSAVAHVPLVGSPLATAQKLTEVAGDLSGVALPQLVMATDDLQPLRAGASGGSVPLAPIESAAPHLAAANTAVGAAQARAHRVHGSWLGLVSHARNQLVAQVDTLHHDLTVATTASQLAPGMLGGSGARTYFVAFLNPAEIRGGGGVIGGYALLRADAGRVTIAKIGGEQDLPALNTYPPGLNAEWLANFQPLSAATVWQNTDLSPDFPSTGAAWAAMYAADFTTKVDGVIAIDPNTLATLLRFSGPISVEGQTVTADNAVRFLEIDEYLLPLTTAQRKGLLAEVGKQVFTKLLHEHLSGQSLFTQVSTDAADGHTHLYAARPAEQALLAPYPVAGILPVTRTPFLEATLTDSGGEKLSQYVTEHVGYTVGSCGSSVRQVVATVQLHNGAPLTALPAYVSTRLDHPPYAVGRNQVKMLLSLYLTSGTQFGSATIDGKDLALLPPGILTSGNAGGLQTSTNKGHPTLSIFVELPAGATRTLTFVLGEPASTARPDLPAAPLPQTPVATFTPGACVH